MDITQPEAAALLATNPVVVIPTGSVEQHGPHLPFGTDYYAALVIARRVAQSLGALLLPFTPLGVTPFHMSFAGTITLSPETYMSLLTDVCESMVKHGARRFVVVNWHEGNTPSIDLVAQRLQQKHPIRFFIVQAAYVAQELFGQQVGLTHGGLLEALAVLAYDPSLARLERGTNPSDPSQAGQMDLLRRRREAYAVIKDVRETSPTGWHGTLEGASVEKAQAYADAVCARVVEYVRQALQVLDGK
jgi:creatinine amidohydrolase